MRGRVDCLLGVGGRGLEVCCGKRWVDGGGGDGGGGSMMGGGGGCRVLVVEG